MSRIGVDPMYLKIMVYHITYQCKRVVTVDEIVIDANMDLQWPHGMSLMPPSPTLQCLGPLTEWVGVLKHLVPN